MGEAAMKKTIPDTLTVIDNRKSVRYFTGESVPPEQIDLLLKAAISVLMWNQPCKGIQN
jgi:hypothetical protein